MENRNGILETFWRFFKRHFDSSFWQLFFFGMACCICVHFYYALSACFGCIPDFSSDSVAISSVTSVLGFMIAILMVIACGLFDRILEKMRRSSGKEPDKNKN